MVDTYFITLGQVGSPESRCPHIQLLARSVFLTIDDNLLAMSSREVMENINEFLPSGPGAELLKPL